MDKEDGDFLRIVRLQPIEQSRVFPFVRVKEASEAELFRFLCGENIATEVLKSPASGKVLPAISSLSISSGSSMVISQ